MAGYNKVILMGNLTKDPEKRYTSSNDAMTTFRLAVNRKYNKQDGSQGDEVLYIDVITWRKLAETCAEYLRKGRQALVEGRLVERSWEGQDGQKRSKVEVQADTVRFIGSREEGTGAPRPAASEPGGAPPYGSDEGGGAPPDDDIPF